MNASKSSSQVFSYLVSLVTVFAVLNWVSILVSYISFRRALAAQGIALEDLPYVGLLQPWGSYYALFISSVVILFNGIVVCLIKVALLLTNTGYDAFIGGFKVDVFLVKYIGLIFYFGNIIFWKFWMKTKRHEPSNIDLYTGRREFEIETPMDAAWRGGTWKALVGKLRN